ncbi:hypothetical protein DNTS_001677, partial [Danionella cerebrum]
MEKLCGPGAKLKSEEFYLKETQFGVRPSVSNISIPSDTDSAESEVLQKLAGVENCEGPVLTDGD